MISLEYLTFATRCHRNIHYNLRSRNLVKTTSLSEFLDFPRFFALGVLVRMLRNIRLLFDNELVAFTTILTSIFTSTSLFG